MHLTTSPTILQSKTTILSKAEISEIIIIINNVDEFF